MISNCFPVKKVDQTFESYKPNLGERMEPEEDQSLSMPVAYIQGFSERFQTIMRKQPIKVAFMKGGTLENEFCNINSKDGEERCCIDGR
mmetsp:Transcript_22081/g.28915  ORF Transcript_22081/g.28915 Transcript_22081/m.28915 type:complete len:89 (-) Transcript_22081:642-908(-)